MKFLSPVKVYLQLLGISYFSNMECCAEQVSISESIAEILPSDIRRPWILGTGGFPHSGPTVDDLQGGTDYLLLIWDRDYRHSEDNEEKPNTKLWGNVVREVISLCHVYTKGNKKRSLKTWFRKSSLHSSSKEMSS